MSAGWHSLVMFRRITSKWYEKNIDFIIYLLYNINVIKGSNSNITRKEVKVMKREGLLLAIDALCKTYQKENGDIEHYAQTDSGIVISFSNKPRREKWIEERLEDLKKFFPYSTVLLNSPKKRMTVVEFSDHFGVCGTGISYCSENDIFDYKTGIAVAYAHFLDIPIPDFI